MRIAANARILKVVNETRHLMRIFAMRDRGHDGEETGLIHRHHSEIVRAIKEQDPSRAMQILTEHVQNSQRERLEEFDHWEREASLEESMPAFLSLFNPV